MLSRGKLAAKVMGGTLIVAAIAVLVLPPTYEARASFITASPAPGRVASAFENTASSRAFASRLGIGAVGDPSESPNFYVQLIESVELRRRLLYSRFEDPRGKSPHDSATLLQILRIRSNDPQRRREIALKKMSKSISTSFDRKTNLVEVTVRLSSPDLAAAAANRTVELVGSFSNEKRLSRNQSARLFIQSRVDSATLRLRDAEERQRMFLDQNRQWRGSPQLSSAEARLKRDADVSKDFFLTLQRQLEAARLNDFNDAALITVIDRAVPPRRAQWPRYGVLLANAVAVACILGLLVAAVATVVADWRRGAFGQTVATSRSGNAWDLRAADAIDGDGSLLSRVVFPLFAWGLVFHSLVMAALFGWFGLPEHVVRAIAAWKEVALAILVVVVIVRAATGHGPRTVFAWADLWIAGLVTIAVLFLLMENLWLRLDLPPAAGLFGIRDAVYFMLAYFVGRAMPELATDEKAMRRIFILIVVTCGIGVVERIIVTPEMLVGLGVASYFQDFLGVSAFTVGNDYGLPLNYWTMIGGHLFRRAGSVYLSGQGFAVPFLLFFPLATAWVFLGPRRSRRQIAAYAIISAGLVLTLTRMTIVVAVIQLIIFSGLRKRPEWAVVAMAAAAGVFVVAFAMIPGFPGFVWETLSWQEGSSVSHVNDWVSGLTVFAENPWGSGLGTTDQTAIRAGLQPLTGDNLFLKYGVEMGVTGLTLLVLTLGALGSSAMTLFRKGVTLNERRMGMTLLLASVGITINGLTAVVFNSIALGWLFFWLAGAAVTAASRLSAVVPSPIRTYTALRVLEPLPQLERD